MSALAEILLSNGYKVSGSDMKYSPIIEKLRQKGAKIYIGHSEENIKDIDLIVYTSAISNDNPELVKAKQLNIPTIDRATFLGQLMKNYENSIAVAGTHGKTTTTGMLSIILDNSEISPTILLGGKLDQIGGNVKLGDNECLLTEACEYKGNFLKFYPTTGIILNIEEDHLDYFKDINHIVDTFKDFASLIPSNGALIINNDDEHASQVIKKANCNVITFGINNNSDITATNIKFNNAGFPTFDVKIKDKLIENVTLGVMGIHNIYNSLAAIACTYNIGISTETIISSLKSYTGTHRRFETKGKVNNITIIDDYAHHPTEIKTTLDTAKKIKANNVWCIFQPHTYTRTKALLNEFSHAFNDADKVIVTDIYAAREKDTGIIHSKDLVNKIKSQDVDVVYMKDFEDIAKYIFKNADDGDIVITMGAGDIFKVGEMLLNNQMDYSA
ncbi:UDP-N-acetylmuramate--alanine ligase [Caldisalinibacter kiritimatiensis]|uniref:UDP-N-acetylmuramate--L-alanine ligase n=2 Tax=Caldisalinibacter kiritimatiensis TaxID=1304284 RepID=R1AT80_9FIRM|nr:UDP-N-acetylmuramate--alanine ligase [Caldisalinibacter kiritimatiensis]